MADDKVIISRSKITALADTIREKSGITNPMSIDNMNIAVQGLSGGDGIDVDKQNIRSGINVGGIKGIFANDLENIAKDEVPLYPANFLSKFIKKNGYEMFLSYKNSYSNSSYTYSDIYYYNLKTKQFQKLEQIYNYFRNPIFFEDSLGRVFICGSYNQDGNSGCYIFYDVNNIQKIEGLRNSSNEKITEHNGYVYIVDNYYAYQYTGSWRIFIIDSNNNISTYISQGTSFSDFGYKDNDLYIATKNEIIKVVGNENDFIVMKFETPLSESAPYLVYYNEEYLYFGTGKSVVVVKNDEIIHTFTETDAPSYEYVYVATGFHTTSRGEVFAWYKPVGTTAYCHLYYFNGIHSMVKNLNKLLNTGSYSDVDFFGALSSSAFFEDDFGNTYLSGYVGDSSGYLKCALVFKNGECFKLFDVYTEIKSVMSLSNCAYIITGSYGDSSTTKRIYHYDGENLTLLLSNNSYYTQYNGGLCVDDNDVIYYVPKSDTKLADNSLMTGIYTVNDSVLSKIDDTDNTNYNYCVSNLYSYKQGYSNGKNNYIYIYNSDLGLYCVKNGSLQNISTQTGTWYLVASSPNDNYLLINSVNGAHVFNGFDDILQETTLTTSYCSAYRIEDVQGNYYFSSGSSSVTGVWKFDGTNLKKITSSYYSFSKTFFSTDGTTFLIGNSSYSSNQGYNLVSIVIKGDKFFTSGLGYSKGDSAGVFYEDKNGYVYVSTGDGFKIYFDGSEIVTRVNNGEHYTIFTETKDGVVYISQNGSQTSAYYTFGTYRCQNGSYYKISGSEGLKFEYKKELENGTLISLSETFKETEPVIFDDGENAYFVAHGKLS